MSSSHHTTIFFLFTIITIASSLPSLEARESHFFSKAAPKQQGEYQPEDFAPLSAFKDTTPPSSEQPPFTASVSESQNHGLYGTDQSPLAGAVEGDRSPDQNPPSTANFVRTGDEFDPKRFTSKDPHSGFSGNGMSDTRIFKNGKYFYDVKNEKYQTGFGPNYQNPTYNGVDRSGSGYGSGFGYPYYKGPSESGVGEDRYGGYGSGGLFTGNYETNNNYSQEEKDDFLP